MNTQSVSRSSQCWIAVLAAVGMSLSALAATNELTTQPDKSMAAAHKSFLKGDMNKASAEIHKAATYVKSQSDKVAAGSKDGVKKSGEALDKLGDDVKAGTVKSEAELNKAFAKTDHALADAWHQTAVAAKNSGKATTRALKQTGSALAGAAHWSGHQLNAGTQKSVDAVKSATAASIKASKDSAKEVDGWFKDLGDGIKEVGQKL
jgi:hypothetical protein